MLEWVRTMPPGQRRQLLCALAECSDAVQEAVLKLVRVITAPNVSVRERKRALMTLAEALFPNPGSDGKYGLDARSSEAEAADHSPGLAHEIRRMDSQEAEFANRLQHLMSQKHVTQAELAQRVGCTQPAISQMLSRRCRPHKKTIMKLAEALSVTPQDLWPDLEVSEILDATYSFQQPDGELSQVEAEALCDTAPRNRAKLPVKLLPKRER
jgi:transcriptional regulator with XRE-family HTH domain